MKRTIKLSFILIMAIGCRKDPQDRHVDIIGFNARYSVSIIGKGNKEGHGVGSGSVTKMCDQNSKNSFTLTGDYKYSYTISSDSSNFNCKVLVDGKNIYHHDGAEHHLEF